MNMNMAEIIKRKEESRWEKHRDGAKKLLEQVKIALEESRFGMGVRLSHIEDVIHCEILDEDFTVERHFQLPYIATMSMVAELAGEEGMYSQRSEGQLYIWPNPGDIEEQLSSPESVISTTLKSCLNYDVFTVQCVIPGYNA